MSLYKKSETLFLLKFYTFTLASSLNEFSGPSQGLNMFEIIYSLLRLKNCEA